MIVRIKSCICRTTDPETHFRRESCTYQMHAWFSLLVNIFNVYKNGIQPHKFITTKIEHSTEGSCIAGYKLLGGKWEKHDFEEKDSDLLVFMEKRVKLVFYFQTNTVPRHSKAPPDLIGRHDCIHEEHDYIHAFKCMQDYSHPFFCVIIWLNVFQSLTLFLKIRRCPPQQVINFVQ